MFRAGFLFPLLVAVPLSAPTSEEHPVRVTTDSATYCLELAARFAVQSMDASEQARALANEGHRLCRSGFVRTGIAKLRRALRSIQADAD